MQYIESIRSYFNASFSFIAQITTAHSDLNHQQKSLKNCPTNSCQPEKMIIENILATDKKSFRQNRETRPVWRHTRKKNWKLPSVINGVCKNFFNYFYQSFYEFEKVFPFPRWFPYGSHWLFRVDAQAGGVSEKWK